MRLEIEKEQGEVGTSYFVYQLGDELMLFADFYITQFATKHRQRLSMFCEYTARSPS